MAFGYAVGISLGVWVASSSGGHINPAVRHDFDLILLAFTHSRVTTGYSLLCFPPPLPMEEGTVVHPRSGIGGNGCHVGRLGKLHARNQSRRS